MPFCCFVPGFCQAPKNSCEVIAEPNSRFGGGAGGRRWGGGGGGDGVETYLFP